MTPLSYHSLKLSLIALETMQLPVQILKRIFRSSYICIKKQSLILRPKKIEYLNVISDIIINNQRKNNFR